MKKHLSVVGAAVFAILVTTSTVFAHGGEDNPMGMGRGMMHGMMGGGMMRMMGMGPGMMSGMMGMMPGMMGMGRGMMGAAYGISLTKEQETKLTDLRVRFLQDAAKAQSELIQARASLQALLLDPSAKDEAIEAQAQKAAKAQGRLFVLRTRMARQVEGVLTKEQREEMMRRFSPGQGMMGPGMMGNPCGTGQGMMNR